MSLHGQEEQPLSCDGPQADHGPELCGDGSPGIICFISSLGCFLPDHLSVVLSDHLTLVYECPSSIQVAFVI